MKHALAKFFKHHFEEPEYQYLMFSIILLLIVPSFVEALSSGKLIMDLTFLLVLVMASVFATSNFKELFFCLALTVLIYFNYMTDTSNVTLGVFRAVLNLVFFLFVFTKLVAFVLKEDDVDPNIIYACICGYFILGIMAAVLFALIENFHPGAFTGTDTNVFYDFVYLSFITLTSVGYGDITPIHPIAKSGSILLSLAGQLYLTFVVAIIVGKYLFYHPKKAA